MAEPTSLVVKNEGSDNLPITISVSSGLSISSAASPRIDGTISPSSSMNELHMAYMEVKDVSVQMNAKNTSVYELTGTQGMLTTNTMRHVELQARDIALAGVQWYYQPVADKAQSVVFSNEENAAIERAYRTAMSRYLAQERSQSTVGVLMVNEETLKPERPENVMIDFLATHPPILVQDYLYEITLGTNEMKPIYTKAPTQKVTRHVWYVLTPGSKGKYIPVDEEKALILEWTYQVKYKADSVDHMHRVKFPSTGEEALFVADDDIYLFPKPWFSSFGPKDVKKGQRLSRGYKQTDWQLREQTARDNIDGPIVCGTSDSADELTHVLFVVHGIGQAMEAVDITDDTNMLRGRMHAMATRFHNNLHGKFLVIPVQWRKGLQFNSENETSIDDITVDGCRGLREMIHSTALDVLFYTNPRTCQLIFSELGTRLLELHEKFTLRHPGFVGRGGKFSIFGHSLGSVLSYDLLSHQHGGVNIDTSKDTTPVTATELAETIPSEYLVDCATDSDELRNAKEQIRKFKATVDNDLIARQQRIQPPPPATNDPFPGCADDSSSLLLPPTHAIGTGTHRITYDVQYPQLPFEVDTLILSGSPIAVFMQVKQLRLKKGNTNSLQSTGARPLVCKLYNLFYPYDPVAYRLEPLLDSSFRSTRPSIVYYYAGGLRLHTAVSQTVEGLGQNILGAKLVMDKGFAQIAKSMTFNMGASKEKELELKRNRTADLERLKRVQQEEQLQLAQSILQTANPDKRLDFMLQDSPVENAYLAAISSHFRYWGDNDVGLFVLSKMFELPDPIDE